MTPERLIRKSCEELRKAKGYVGISVVAKQILETSKIMLRKEIEENSIAKILSKKEELIFRLNKIPKPKAYTEQG